MNNNFALEAVTLRKHVIDMTVVDVINTMASLRHILMGRNGDYFLNYIDYSKNFDAVLKLLLGGVHKGRHLLLGGGGGSPNGDTK